MASSPGDTVPRVSSNPPASPEDDIQELVELSCIQGWSFSLPRGDVLCSKAPGQGSQGPQSGRWPQVLSARCEHGLSSSSWWHPLCLICMNVMLMNMKGEMRLQQLGQPQPLHAVLSWTEHTACPLQQQSWSWDWDQASKLLTLLWQPGFSPGVSRSRRVRGCPMPLSISPHQVPMGRHGLGSATAAEGTGHSCDMSLCPQPRAHPWHCSSPAQLPGGLAKAGAWIQPGFLHTALNTATWDVPDGWTGSRRANPTSSCWMLALPRIWCWQPQGASAPAPRWGRGRTKGISLVVEE